MGMKLTDFDCHTYYDTFGLKRCLRTSRTAAPATATVIFMHGQIAGVAAHRSARVMDGVPGKLFNIRIEFEKGKKK